VLVKLVLVELVLAELVLAELVLVELVILGEHTKIYEFFLQKWDKHN